MSNNMNFDSNGVPVNGMEIGMNTNLDMNGDSNQNGRMQEPAELNLNSSSHHNNSKSKNNSNNNNRRSLSPGPRASMGAKARGLMRGLRPRRSKSGDSCDSFGTNSNHSSSAGLAGKRHSRQSINSNNSNSNISNMNGSAHGAVSPTSVTPARSKSGDSQHGKSRGLRASTPGAVASTPNSQDSTSTPANVSPSPTGKKPTRGLSGDSQHGKVRGLRASTPGAMASSSPTDASLSTSAHSPVPTKTTPMRGLSGDSQHGKMRGLRASTPGAVASADTSLGNSAHSPVPTKATPTRGLSGDSQRGKIRGLRASTPGAVSSTDGSLSNSAHSPIKTTPTRGLSGDSQHKKMMMAQQSSSSTPTSPADPEAIRRKQIQDIMKETGLSAKEKQQQIQQLMAGGMPKASDSDNTDNNNSNDNNNNTTTTPEDPQAIRRKQIQDIQKMDNLTPKEKQAKIQELMAGGMPKASAATKEEETASQRTNGRSISPARGRRGLRKSNTIDSTSDGSPSRSNSPGFRRTLSSDGSNKAAAAMRRTRSGEGSPPQGLVRTGTIPTPGADLGEELEVPAEQVAANNNKKGKDMKDASANSEMSGSAKSLSGSNRISRRNRIAIKEVQRQDEEEEDAQQAAAEVTKESSGVGGAPQGKMRRTGTAPTTPGAVSVVEPANLSSSSHGNNVTGVGGAPQGKMRRAGTAPSKPGAVSVVEPSGLSSTSHEATTGVGGAPQGKIRRTGTAPVQAPGAVSVVEPGSLTSSSHVPNTGVGGAPQGKFRRTGTTPVSTPGAVSVEPSAAPSEPGSELDTSNNDTGATTGTVGGAPQGKIRRTTVQATKPGAVSVLQRSSTDSSATTATTAASSSVGGAPQGKIRRTTVTSTPGAVSVDGSLDVSEPGASTGVGGAPQGKARRVTTVTTPGAVHAGANSVVSEPGAATGVGGAPQGKVRRVTAAGPGAMSVAGSSSGASEPGAAVGVGGAPQGKFRRATAASKPGAVSTMVPQTAVEPNIDASSHHGNASLAGGSISSRASAVSKEPHTLVPGLTGRGLDATNHKSLQNEPRTLIPAVSVRAMQTSDHRPMQMSDNKSLHSTEPRTLVDNADTSAIIAATESDMLAKSAVRRSRPADVRPGAQMVTPTPSLPAGEDTDAVINSIEADMMAKSNARGRRVSSAVVQPGAQSVVADNAEPDADMTSAVNLVERDMLAKARARAPMSPMSKKHLVDGEELVSNQGPPLSPTPSNRGLVGNTAPSSRGLTISPPLSPSGRGLSSNAAPSSRGLSSNAAPSNRGLSSNAAPSARGLGRNIPVGISSASSVGRSSVTSSVTEPSHLSVTSHQDRYNSDDVNPAEESDFTHAVNLVESDLQAKLRAQEPSGVRQGDSEIQEPSEMRPYEDEKLDTSIKEQEAADYIMESANAPRTMQDRMEQKIIQMEQEQRARDDKLEEIEEVNNRRGPSRQKIHPSPRGGIPEMEDEESGPIENGFLTPDPEAIRRAEEDGLAIAVAVDEEDEPQVYDVELKMYDPEAKPPFFKNRRFRCYTALICLITIAAIIAAAVLSAKEGSKTIVITQAPSQAPSQAPTSTRDTAVRGELARVIGDIVNEPGTVYEAALEWILYEDPMMLDEFSENLIQRYILALFYFKTSQQGPWISCNPPAEGEDSSCEYYEMGRLEDNSIAYTPREELETRWLSERHECEWSDVVCHPETFGNVIAIDILGQNLTGTMPDELKYLDRLMWLSLSFNYFTGTIPEVYGEFPYLTIFECTENMMTGQIPSGFFNQPNLLQLNPAYNMLTGTLPPEIGDLTALHSLFLFGTQISGSLPTEMGYLEDVRNLWLYDNLLSGAIPSEIGQLSLLETLYLSNNLHSGPLPSEMGLLSNLEEILMMGNNMGGSAIPEEFWNITSMRAIDFNGASFGGTISSNIAQMTNLYGFKGSRNLFSGTIPTEIGLLDSLNLLWLHLNENLQGEMPLEICQLRGPESLMFLNADCSGSTPRMACVCCTACCDEFGQCQVMT